MPDLGLTPSVRPSVGFTDTFHTAPAPDLSGIAELSSALDKFSNRAASVIDDKYQELSEEELAEGRAAYEASRVQLNGAIKEGVIPAGATPHFRRGWRLSQLSNLATSVDSQLRQEYAESPVRNSDNVDEVRAWYATRANELLIDNGGNEFSPAMLTEAFYPGIRHGEASLGNNHVNERIKFAEEQAEIELDISFQSTLQGISDNDGWEDNPSVNASAAGQTLQARADEMVANGMSPTTVNRILQEAILTHAQDVNDPDVLSVADHIRTGTGKLAGTSAWREASERVEDALQSERERAIRFNDYQVEKRRADATRSVMTSAIQTILNDPSADLSEQMSTLSRVDPASALSLDRAQKQLLEREQRVVEDHEDVAELNHLAILNPDGAIAAAIRGVSEGRFTQDTVRATIALATSTRNNGGLFADAIINGEITSLRSVILGNEFDATSDSAETWRRAQRDIKIELTQWVASATEEANGTPPPRSEVYKAISAITDRAARRYASDTVNTVNQELNRTSTETVLPEEGDQTIPSWAD